MGYSYNLASLVQSIASVLELGLFIYIVISLLISFNVINSYNQFVSVVYTTLGKIFEPMLRPIRNILPDMGGLDLSPILLFIAIRFISGILVSTIFKLA